MVSVHKTDDLYSLKKIAPIESVLEEARKGKMYIVVDDEGRENEGDIVISAQFATPSVINFMITHGRGLVCLPILESRAKNLHLTLQPRSNEEKFKTAFTTSIDASTGITTGISAFDRAHTIAVAIDEQFGPTDIVTPGHIFPLIAAEDGVLTRNGHTEASTDIAKIAGQNPAAVICEILNKDGTMARLPEIISFAETFDLKICTIADLVEYRKKYARKI